MHIPSSVSVCTSKETCISAKEPCISTKEPCWRWIQLLCRVGVCAYQLSLWAPLICAKETCISAKEPYWRWIHLFWRVSVCAYQLHTSSVFYIRKRDLYIRKRALVDVDTPVVQCECVRISVTHIERYFYPPNNPIGVTRMWRDLHLKRNLYIRKRALYICKRALLESHECDAICTSKELCTSAKEPCISAKEPYWSHTNVTRSAPQKSPVYPQKSPVYLQKSPITVTRMSRDLHLKKDLYIRKKEPYWSRTNVSWSAPT